MIRRWIAVAALVAALGPALALAGDPDRDDGAARTAYQIDVRDGDGRGASIDRVMVVGDGTARVAQVRQGFSRRNQARVDYSAVPVLGHLSEHRYDKEDFGGADRVGVVRIDGRDLILLLDVGVAPAPADVTMVAVLNGQYAYESRRPPRSAKREDRAAWESRGRQVGALYRNGDGRLLALIRPFVVTDSGLW